MASGRFAEVVTLAPTMVTPNVGNINIKAAPGVEAMIDAVLQGDPAGGNVSRQNNAGIIVNMPANRRVTLENLTVRNYTFGIYVGGASQVSIINCRVTNNLNFGILVEGTARVSIDESHINANGFRIGGPTAVANPGAGVVFQRASNGAIFRSEISGNFAVGFSDQSTGSTEVKDVFFFGNNPDF